MVATDSDGSGGAPDIYELFCHYNALYFRDALGSCAVSWADDDNPLPDRDVSRCDYHPGGGGCMIILSKSLYECHDSDLKNVLLHEMIHAYICIEDNNNNHSDHGAKFQKLMNTINMSFEADPHRPVGGYGITMLHEIRKRDYHYKCGNCGDLMKSMKMRGPSHDDCIEKRGAHGLCQNSKCHWHRHKKRCSGSYHRLEESSPGMLELKPIKAEEAINEGKAEEPICKSWHPTHTSNKSRKNEREDASAGFLCLADKAVGCSGEDSSSRDRSNKKIKISKDVSFELKTLDGVEEAPKRPRTAAPKSQECSRRKKRKQSMCDGYSVIIEWLNYYCISESDEDEVPLINKRTERRKRQKLIEMSLAREFGNSVSFGGSTSHTVDGTKDVGGSYSLGSRVIVPASRHEEGSLPNHAVGSYGVAGNQAQTGNESISSPLDSPIGGEIVDISDG